MKEICLPDFLKDEEIYSFNHGKYYHSYLKLGAHPLVWQGVSGVHFAVWAPRARAVSVVGTFNDWQPDKHQLRLQGNSGIWQGFWPDLGPGMMYKYAIRGRDDRIRMKADPFAFQAELRPATASLIREMPRHEWQDRDWMEQRARSDFRRQPLLIYELHIGSWRMHPNGNFYTYRELAESLVPYLHEMGFNYLELMPVMEHPLDASWGYQLTSYYAVTSRYGDAEGLMYLIDRCHQAGIGVILDWVPGHFCPDEHGLADFDGEPLYETEKHRHWGTYKFDFRRMEVWSFLISNAMYWMEVFHADGLRVDGVSSMLYLNFDRDDYVPNRQGGKENLEAIAFLQQLNRQILSAFPGTLMIAEESTDWPLVTAPPHDGGLGFSFKWDMGWMNDTLDYMENGFEQRSKKHNLLTFSMMYAFAENFILPLSHDEMVHGKKSLIGRMPGDYEQQFAGLRLLYLYQLSHPGAKLLFMGSEFGQFIEWDYRKELDWFLLDYEMHRCYHNYIRDINRLYLKERSLWEQDHDWEGFHWIDSDNRKQSILVYERRAALPMADPRPDKVRVNSRRLMILPEADPETLILIINLQPQAYHDFRIGVPYDGWYQEILNTDDAAYGGSGGWCNRRIPTEALAWQGHAQSLNLKLPPLGGLILKAIGRETVLEKEQGNVSCC